MKLEILKGSIISTVFVSNTGNPDLDGLYIAEFGKNPSVKPLSFNDGGTPLIDLTVNSIYNSDKAIHTIKEVGIDSSKNVYDNTGQSYVKILTL